MLQHMNFAGTHTFNLWQGWHFLSPAVEFGDLRIYGQRVKSDIDGNFSQQCLEGS